VFLQLVEFPSQAAAASNSDHPATAEFAAALAKISEGEIVYRNLDVVAANTF
jgi:inactivated superfamily I helicase